MARVIPREFPSDNTSSAEWRLFEAFRDGLGKDWLVLHSVPWLDDTGRTLREGECDFLVLHPERGMLAVEAKSGGVRYDGPSRAWLRDRPRPGRGGTATVLGEVLKDPFRQAANSAHYLNEILRRRVPEWNGVAPPFGHAVAFPESDSLPGNLPAHASPDILILRPDLERLQARVEAILGRYREPSACLMPESLNKVIGALLPSFEVAVPLAASLERQESALFRLTEEQIRLIDQVALNRRAVVRGPAGAGKTILALEKAIRLADEGKRVLLLCYNVPLAARLREQVDERGASPAGKAAGKAGHGAEGGVEVFCFHDLIEHVVKAAGGTYEVPLENRQEFYDRTAIDLLYGALPAYERRWDAVIVDEAQDFATEWWPAIEDLLASGEEGVLYVFTDPGQDLFRRAGQLPIEAPVFVLDRNCRNTAAIAELVGRYGPPDATALPAAHVAEGIPPVIEPVGDEQEEREAVRRALHHLVHERGIRPERIVILGRHRFQHSAFAEQSKLGAFQVIDNLEPGAPHHVRYATIYRFKGLEADCALITGIGIDPGDPRAPAALDEGERALLYVAASRAKLLLYVFPLVKPRL